MKRFCALLLCAVLLCMALPWQTRAAEMDVNAKSALLMDAATGTVLFEKNAHEALAPASVTKIMTMLLIMEAIDSGSIGYDDMVTASESAAAKGGSGIGSGFMDTGTPLHQVGRTKGGHLHKAVHAHAAH